MSLTFCPTCGNLLMVETTATHRLRFSCRTCPYVYNIDKTVRTLSSSTPQMPETLYSRLSTRLAEPCILDYHTQRVDPIRLWATPELLLVSLGWRAWSTRSGRVCHPSGANSCCEASPRTVWAGVGRA
jgi:ribosomal protein S27AE